MKPITLALTIAGLALAQSLRAETTVTLNHVHLCCTACVKGVERALTKVSGASAACDRKAGTVAITAPDKATAQKAVDAIINAGYFGTSADAAIKVKDISGAKDQQVKSLTVSGVHLCCGKCVDSVNDALSTVKGVKNNTAEKGAKSFEITGDFNAKEVFAALNKAGLSGRAGR